mmetsp:Transcript_57677/g.137203  ORF Transcript_57677/g.137203 Transcript_57677/m.137203 type:complete len:260 (+) Transcript_57677:170-949(+)|eukprot:CAMPEP_0178422080 /NCGR_PEP_ID=MMETSP0689_2-20121128/26987_1 /TAXON_ID=160604 /ORGANISM="Amphidinium massartii, Strain CS-259" /LENGTH=259 /DNA_ID=CAMNT_0020043629 /DNA_START=95 /DNA_END=874 /DNA_ORIENTATION=-
MFQSHAMQVACEDLISAVTTFLGPVCAMELRCTSPAVNVLLPHSQLVQAALEWGQYCSSVDPAQLSEEVRVGSMPTNDLATAILQASAAGLSISKPNEFGQTALMWAAGHGSAALCTLLLASGAELEAVDSGRWTALLRAAWHGKLEAARVLLRAGADVNTAAARYTPLMAAARFGHAALVEELLQAGADPMATTPFGETALTLARHGHHKEVAELLKDSRTGVDWSRSWCRHAVGMEYSRRKAQAEFDAALARLTHAT